MERLVSLLKQFKVDEKELRPEPCPTRAQLVLLIRLKNNLNTGAADQLRELVKVESKIS